MRATSARPVRVVAPLALLVAALLATRPAAAEDEPRMTARLAPEVVGLDETAILSIEVAAGGFASLAPKPSFELENLEVVAGPSRSENFRFVNGETARSVSFQWQLRPLAVGTARVRALTVRLGEAERRLDDLEVRVEAEAPPGRAAAPRNAPGDPFAQLFPELFAQRQAPRTATRAPKVRLAATLDPPEPFVGQQAVFTLYLLTQADVHRVSPRDLPDFRGFWVREIQLPERPRPEWVEVDGERFGRVPLLRRALFPLAPGRYEIPPVTVDAVVDVTELTPWGTPLARPAEVRRTTERLLVPVRALPADPPSGFAGTVGSLAVHAKLEPTTVTVGEAATLTLTVSGTGNLRGLPDPEPGLPEGIRRFPPQGHSAEELAGERLKSTRSWSYVIVPEREGGFHVPPFELAYLDPKSGQYRIAAGSALELTARPRPSTPPPAVAATSPTPEDPSASGAGGPSEPPGAATWLPAALWAGSGALVTLGALGALAAFRRSRSPRTRSRARLLARLAEAKRENRPRQAAGAIEDAWRDYLAERWHLPAGTPVTQWGALLASQGVGEETAERLIAFLSDLHLLHFAPELSATETLAADLVERSRRLASELH